MLINDNYLYPYWKDYDSQMICGFSLPKLGNQALTRDSISSKHTTEENRKKLAALLKINLNTMFSPHQIHSDHVIWVDKNRVGFGAFSLQNALKADACITNLHNVLLLTSWADCIPILLFEPEHHWIASVHSGWRGACMNIIAKTINFMRKKKINTNNLYAAIGPGIRGCCYQVGIDLIKKFDQLNIAPFLRESISGFYFDLTSYVYQQLIEEGINPQKIDLANKCTCCSKEPVFFSSRKDGENFEGQAAFIGIFDRDF